MAERQTVSDKLKTTNWPLVAGLVFFITVLLVMAVGYNQLVNWLMDAKAVPIRQVLVSGERVFTPDEQISAKVLNSHPGSFFSVDVNAVREAVESLPWVYRASIRKQWPDVVTVHVIEQQSVAVWNDQWLLNTQGEMFIADIAVVADVLPHIYGPLGSESEALQGFRDLDSLLRINGFAVNKLTLSERFSWQVMLDNGIKLELGRHETIKRVQRFIDLYSVISAHKPTPVVSVDLRYETGMAVQWAQDDNNKQIRNG